MKSNEKRNMETDLCMNKICIPYCDLLGINPAKYRYIKISNFLLSVQSYNCLKNAKINTLEDFLKLSDEKLMNLRNLGKENFKEIKHRILEQNDFSNVGSILQKDFSSPYYKQIGVDPAEYRHIKISNFLLSVQSYNCLKNAKINTLEDFLKLSDEKLMNLRNLGKENFKEIKHRILEQNDFLNVESILQKDFSSPYYKQIGVNPKKYNHIKISEFLLSMNSYNCLKNANINTLGDLLQLSDNELRGIKNLSLKSFNEIKKQLLCQENFNGGLTIQQFVGNSAESLDQVNDYYDDKDKTRIYKDFRNISPEVFELAMNSDYKITDLLWESKYDEFVALCLGNGITKAGALLFVPFRNDQLVNLFYYKKLRQIINKVKDWLEGLSLNQNEEEYSTDAILRFFWRN